MKPGPATSTEVTSGSAFSFGLIASASARGFVPAPLASTIAALVARSPCEGSRGGSTVTRARSMSGGSTPSDEVVEHSVEERGILGVKAQFGHRCGKRGL